jgi:ribose/xylose/arabinose/galactoside ABC-type transport system permease subunit
MLQTIFVLLGGISSRVGSCFSITSCATTNLTTKDNDCQPQDCFIFSFPELEKSGRLAVHQVTRSLNPSTKVEVWIFLLAAVLTCLAVAFRSPLVMLLLSLQKTTTATRLFCLPSVHKLILFLG